MPGTFDVADILMVLLCHLPGMYLAFFLCVMKSIHNQFLLNDTNLFGWFCEKEMGKSVFPTTVSIIIHHGIRNTMLYLERG